MTMDLPTREDFENLRTELASIKELLFKVLEYNGAPDVVNVRFVAKVENLSVSGIRKQPWLLPDYGRSEYPGEARWRYETFVKWRNIPVSSRRTAWQRINAERIKGYIDD